MAMAMSEHEHDVEGKLVVNIRRVLVSWVKLRDQFFPDRPAKEVNRWMKELASALAEYEEMMVDRDDGRR